MALENAHGRFGRREKGAGDLDWAVMVMLDLVVADVGISEAVSEVAVGRGRAHGLGEVFGQQNEPATVAPAIGPRSYAGEATRT